MLVMMDQLALITTHTGNWYSYQLDHTWKKGWPLRQDE